MSPEDDKLEMSQSIVGYLEYFFWKKIYLQKPYEYVYVCMHDGPVWMHTITNDGNNLFDNTHVRIKIYRDFHHGIIYITNERRNVRIEYERICAGFYLSFVYI